MIEFLSDPNVWASFLTLAVLEIVLGVDNVIFISIAATKLPASRRPRARVMGLAGALVLRIALLLSIAWLAGLSTPIASVMGFAVSWRDIVLMIGGLFLIYKAATEIFDEVEGKDTFDTTSESVAGAAFLGVVAQIMALDLVFSVDSVITAVGIADDVEVMIAAIVVSILVMIAFANPIADFIEDHPSTKMLALAFLVMVGMALVADACHFHVERGFIYAAMLFAGAVEALNLLRHKRRRHAPRN